MRSSDSPGTSTRAVAWAVEPTPEPQQLTRTGGSTRVSGFTLGGIRISAVVRRISLDPAPSQAQSALHTACATRHGIPSTPRRHAWARWWWPSLQEGPTDATPPRAFQGVSKTSAVVPYEMFFGRIVVLFRVAVDVHMPGLNAPTRYHSIGRTVCKRRVSPFPLSYSRTSSTYLLSPE
jgi:hypothetical protein